ncbi:MAG: serine/threonine-protein kinase [Leptolyngbyaceae cyanobacterium bins.349]|nr:serine/threonine-protein kinase [Leptolyngbyaceae cyanobacterium bins.349]
MSHSLAKELRRSKYRLLGLVGQGQFGRVYCASHRRTGRLVALKELGRDRFSTHKFLRELRFLLSLQHENIVTCHAMEQTATGRYLVMDYCEAGTLRGLLEEDVRLHPVHGLHLIVQILAGLEHAHQREIVHCDIKPENILLTANAQGWTARISDFGIARLSQEIAKDEFSNTGSPAYMAPERFYGQYSIASDLYAVGILLFELLVGQRPFSGVPAELMSAHLNQTVQIPDTIPVELQTILRRALQKLPARRFRSAQAMLTELQQVIAQTEVELSRGWTPQTLLYSCQPFTPVIFQHQYQEILETPIQQLANTRPLIPPQSAPPSLFQTERFFRVYGNQVGYQPYAEDHLVISPVSASLSRHPPASMIRVRLPAAIAHLHVQAQGCFAVTHHALYWLPAALFTATPGASSQWQPTESADPAMMPQLVTEFERRTLVAIAPNGRWLATTSLEIEATSQQIHVWKLCGLEPFKSALSFSAPAGFQLLAPDSRHLTLFSHVTDPDSTCITGVQIGVFSRRGTEIARLTLPLPLRQMLLTATPYRLLATEPNYPTSLLFLDLKPLRIQRIGLDIAPAHIAVTAWGCAIANVEGHIILLNQYGQLVGRIAGPPQPTALSFVAPHQLLVATWQGSQGNLYCINLRDLDLDILF